MATAADTATISTTYLDQEFDEAVLAHYTVQITLKEVATRFAANVPKVLARAARAVAREERERQRRRAIKAAFRGRN